MGATRIAATDDTGDIDPVAFINRDGSYAVVLRARSATAVTVRGLPDGDYTTLFGAPAAPSLSQGSATSSGGLLRANLDIGVTALVGQGSAAPGSDGGIGSDGGGGNTDAGAAPMSDAGSGQGGSSGTSDASARGGNATAGAGGSSGGAGTSGMSGGSNGSSGSAGSTGAGAAGADAEGGADDSSGCGCRLGAPARSGRSSLWLALGALVLARRRSRRV
jgi:hypothetical protein